MNIPGLDFTVEELQSAIEQGRVSARPHAYKPYQIYNYTPEVVFNDRWDRVTLQCRGLILADDPQWGKTVVARPWAKFFNLGQVNLPADFVEGPLEVTDKLDGSLGILYMSLECPEGDHYSIATRGSFESDQAHHASKVWAEKYEDFRPVADLTYLFEIVYPGNRIVLDYQDMDDLVLLGAVQKSTGYYVGPTEAAARLYSYERETPWTGPVAKVFEHQTLSDVLGDTARANAEGFVIRKHNFLVKVKQTDYLELHRLVTNCTPRRVWEQLRDGKSVIDIVSAFPDEFHSWVQGMADPLTEQFQNRADEVIRKFEEYSSLWFWQTDNSRKGFADMVKNDPDRRYMFLLLDRKPINMILWDELRPSAVEVNDGSE